MPAALSLISMCTSLCPDLYRCLKTLLSVGALGSGSIASAYCGFRLERWEDLNTPSTSHRSPTEIHNPYCAFKACHLTRVSVVGFKRPAIEFNAVRSRGLDLSSRPTAIEAFVVARKLTQAIEHLR